MKQWCQWNFFAYHGVVCASGSLLRVKGHLFPCSTLMPASLGLRPEYSDAVECMTCDWGQPKAFVDRPIGAKQSEFLFCVFTNGKAAFVFFTWCAWLIFYICLSPNRFHASPLFLFCWASKHLSVAEFLLEGRKCTTVPLLTRNLWKEQAGCAGMCHCLCRWNLVLHVFIWLLNLCCNPMHPFLGVSFTDHNK